VNRGRWQSAAAAAVAWLFGSKGVIEWAEMALVAGSLGAACFGGYSRWLVAPWGAITFGWIWIARKWRRSSRRYAALVDDQSKLIREQQLMMRRQGTHTPVIFVRPGELGGRDG
jgi:hypothetical protein